MDQDFDTMVLQVGNLVNYQPVELSVRLSSIINKVRTFAKIRRNCGGNKESN